MPYLASADSAVLHGSMSKPPKSSGRALPPDESAQQLAVARDVMARRKGALADLAQWDLAEQIMKEDAEMLRTLSKR